MWPLYKTTVACPNCGHPDFDPDKEGFECTKCAYKKPNFVQGDAVCLMYCKGCGCTYSNGCPTHALSNQEKIKV